jgi:threonylcarbamoyladenosine tRNA methylthiotransferase MtaB
MNRNYDTAFFRDLVGRIHGLSPEIALGIDVIAGFPGETESSFRRTLRFIEDLPVAYLHVFPYSRRPGTPAAAMPAQVPEADKKRRAEELRRIGAGKKQAFATRFIGSPLPVLIEDRKDLATGSSLGFSDNYIAVACRGPAEANRIVDVLPVSFRDGLLTAELMSDSGAGGVSRR